jgi:hypothetical protein
MRGRGGFIGVNVTPSAAAASGVWTLREQESAKRAGTWPRPAAVPQLISGLQLWLDGSDAATLFDTTSGGSLVAADGAVARWEDISGNARHVTQGTSSARPVRKTGIQNGLAVVRFDGSNDFMSVASSTATFKFLHGSDHTLFFVVKPRALNTREFLFETGPFGSPSGDGGALGACCLFNTTGTVLHYSRAGVTAEVSNLTSASTVAAGTCYVVSIVAQPSNGTASLRSSIRINGGAAIANNTQSDSVSSSNARIDLTFGRGIGYQGDGSTEYNDYSDLDYCEVVIYNAALSDTDRAAVESYLTTKWGIS